MDAAELPVGASVRQDRQSVTKEDHINTHRQRTGAPIAQVLNDETPLLPGVQPIAPVFVSSAPPFSGRLADLLLDPLETTSSRTEQDVQHYQIEINGSSTSVITLPKLPQLPVKTVKRPRIPPLLQGLHQPPPLPTGRLFPPITSDQGNFAGESRDRRVFDVHLETAPTLEASNSVRAVNASVNVSDRLLDVTLAYEPPTAHEENLKEKAGHFENVLSLNEDKIATSEHVDGKPSRKRKRWSDEETKDLLLGVSKFGIGNWKKILHHPDFTFTGRTAVDLKDRFRVCRPGDGLKERKLKGKESTEEQTPTPLAASTTSPIQHPGINQSSLVCNDAVPVNDKDTPASKPSLDNLDLAHLGIHGPFIKSTRRPRREFTAEDDVNLLKGFKKYGASWHSMRDDDELGFRSRHPTDLRDRFRIRYSKEYAKAGYKLKKKTEVGMTASSAVINGQSKAEGRLSKDPTSVPTNQSQDTTKNTMISTSDSATMTGRSRQVYATGKKQDALTYLSHPLPAFTEDLDIDYDHDFGDESPPTLNRDILQWADVSTSVAMLALPTGSNHATDLAQGDISWGLFPPENLFHINSMAPPTFHNDTSPASQDRYHKLSDRHNYTTSLTPTKPSTHSATTSTSLMIPTPSSRNTIPQTPNLPNIVYPHVPAASARNTVHNLPGPADLLGVDLDRPLPQTLGTTLDDALGFVNSA
ncbi:hypothetical protein ACN47E_000276 [Coniothyrium glycines]